VREKVGPKTREAANRAVHSWWLRLLISAGLLAAVLTQIDLAAAVDRLGQGQWGLFAAAIAVYLAAFSLGVVRWHTFLEAAGLHRGILQTAEAYFAGVFAMNFLPSTLGGDAVRAWIGGGPGARVKAFSTVLVDRGTLLGCAFIVGWVAAAADADNVPLSLVLTLAGAFGAYLLGVAAVFAAAHVAARNRHRIPRRLVAFGNDVIPVARAALSSGIVLAWTTALGLAYEILTVLGFWLAARAVNVHISLLVVAVVVPSVLVLSSIPVSIGGLGVREGSYIALLGPVGVSATNATVVSLLAATAFAVATLPGAVAVLRRPSTRMGRPALQPPADSSR
jgi:glycosyltransferase 2 family protein